MNHLMAFILKMKEEGLPSIVIDTFIYYYEQILQGETGLICDEQIQPLARDDIEEWENLVCYSDTGASLMKQAVMIVLNGGLGTSMGLTGPKSLLSVKDDKSFLDIILKQAESAKVKLVLMNSFSTDKDTRSALQKSSSPVKPMMFLQHKFPKVLQKDLSPAVWEKNPASEWNPPGHGDIYTALLTSGMLDKLLQSGIRYAFISNSDNLGSSIDETLLGYFAENEFPFMMEVAQRTPADCKGGHLARHDNRRLVLREAAQCPGDEVDAFRDIRRYRFFNTNNLWVDLKYLKELIQQERVIRLPMILNPKTLDPRDEASPKVFQVETAMGAAISLFGGATAVIVPRSRFLPVKKCNELLLIRSDLFRFSPRNTLIPNPDCSSDELPHIRLDSRYYGKTDLFDQRFPCGVPSLLECNGLTIDGDVRFEQNVKLRGRVRIRNTKTNQAVITAGSVLEGDIGF
ncbi:MAG: UTP--glucose-1-phosphate uridylyltransferase [Desulfobacteraceae bacterium]|nr:UTP--glucose-1-phosphate uridylyltransferase [Desulfobacteraceae bacterium]